MLKKDVLDFFGSVKSVCYELDITKVAFCNWGEIIPELRAYQVQVKTNNILKVEESMYPRKIRKIKEVRSNAKIIERNKFTFQDVIASCSGKIKDPFKKCQ